MFKKSSRSILSMILSITMTLSLLIQPVSTFATDTEFNYGYITIDKDSSSTYKISDGINEYEGYIYNGYSFVPVRVFNDLHIPDASISVVYIPETKEVTVNIEGHDSKEGFVRTLSVTPLDLSKGLSNPTVTTTIISDGDSRIVSTPMAVLNIDGNLYVPQQVLSEGLIIKTIWDPTTALLTVTGDTNDLAESDGYYKGEIITCLEPIKIPDEDDVTTPSGLDLQEISIPIVKSDVIKADEFLDRLGISAEDLAELDLSKIDWDYYLKLIQDEDALRELLSGYADEEQIDLIVQAAKGILGSDAGSIGGSVYSTIEDMLDMNIDSMISGTNADIKDIYSKLTKDNDNT